MSRDFHPTGQVTLEGSVVVDANNYSSSHDNQTTLKGTLADPRGIPVSGMRSVNATFDLYITNEGPEFEAVKFVEEGRQAVIGYKFPANGVNILAKITFAKVDVKQSLGDAFTLTVTVMGHTIDSQGI